MKVFVLSVLIFLFAAVYGAVHTKWNELKNDFTFEKYLHEHPNKQYESKEYSTRRGIFEDNLKKIIAHNQDSSKSWKMGVNHLTDQTPEEIAALRGYNKKLASSKHGRGNGAQPHKLMGAAVPISSLPAKMDWRLKGAISPVKDQGKCGSCWTFAAAATIESHFFLKHGVLTELSEQQIASCSTNPRHCGGTGGCSGGTAEVAFGSVFDYGGLASEWTYPYISHQGIDVPCRFNATITPPVAELAGFVKLPSNEFEPLMRAIATVGPIAISVDASNWSHYESGIFDGCNQSSPSVDHAVVLVGYGSENGSDYWIVRNSWTPFWGEGGFIRLRRDSGENQRCGVDVSPSTGSGCDDGPSSVKVCGTCGILFDNAYPLMV